MDTRAKSPKSATNAANAPAAKAPQSGKLLDNPISRRRVIYRNSVTLTREAKKTKKSKEAKQTRKTKEPKKLKRSKLVKIRNQPKKQPQSPATLTKAERRTAAENSLSKNQAWHETSWQNPVINYWSEKNPNWAKKHRKRLKQRPKISKTKRLERQILAMLAFFSISVGLWENFRQLWLQENGFSATDVGNIIGVGTIASAVALLLVGKYVKMARIKKFTTLMLSLRCLDLLLLALINGTGWRWLIDVFAILDITSSAVIIISIYPLLTTIIKSNAVYSRRKLVEYLFRDVGIMIGGIFIGQQIGGLVINYNACLLIAIVFLIIASIIMYRLNLPITEKAPDDTKFSALRYILGNKLQRGYMVYTFLAGTAYNTAIALKMLMLTDSFGFSAGIATNYLLVVGLSADFIGILALKYFTPKSDYLAMSIKFGVRGIFLAIAFLSGSNFICFLALTWTLLSSTAYENVSDGYYINAVDNRHQLKYNTLRYVVHHLGIALGTFLCGQMFQFGPGPIFGLAALIIVFQLIAAFYLIHLRHSMRRK